jgi:DNA invertase Pin-like site-specific DNA recombinase
MLAVSAPISEIARQANVSRQTIYRIQANRAAARQALDNWNASP